MYHFLYDTFWYDSLSERATFSYANFFFEKFFENVYPYFNKKTKQKNL